MFSCDIGRANYVPEADLYNPKKIKYWVEKKTSATMTAKQLLRETETLSYEVDTDGADNILPNFTFDLGKLDDKGIGGASGTGERASGIWDSIIIQSVSVLLCNLWCILCAILGSGSSTLEQELQMPSLEGNPDVTKMVPTYLKAITLRCAKLMDTRKKLIDIPEKDRTDAIKKLLA